MIYQSIIELSGKWAETELSKEVEKRKNNSLSVNFDNFFFSYEFSFMEMYQKIFSNVQKINEMYSLLSDFERKILLRELAINELVSSSKDRFIPFQYKKVFENWIFDNSKKNSSLVDGYRLLLNGELTLPKTINDLQHLYNIFIRPRNNELHLKNVKKFHYFRTEEVSLQETSNLFIDYKGDSDEQSIIKNISGALDFLNSYSIDSYSKVAVFFFLFMRCMPYYNENYFMAKLICSIYFFQNENSPILALFVSKILEPHKELLRKTFKETLSDNNRGDIGHFAYTFLKILNDGTNRILQKLAILNEKKNDLKKDKDKKESKNFLKIKELFVSSSIYTTYGISIYEVEDYLNTSIPTINRFIKEHAKELSKTRFIKRNYYKYK